MTSIYTVNADNNDISNLKFDHMPIQRMPFITQRASQFHMGSYSPTIS